MLFKSFLSKENLKKPNFVRNNPLSFLDFCKELLVPSYFPSIFDFQINMYNFAFDNEQTTKMLLAKRGIGKTDIISCLGTLYQIYLNPYKSIQIISETHTKATNILAFINARISSNKDFFRDIFDNDSCTKTQIRTIQNNRKEPSIYLGSINSSLRGTHPDIIVLDDPLTLETAYLKSARDLALRTYNEAKFLTKNVVIIGNPCHPADLYTELRYNNNISKLEIFNNYPGLPDIFVENVEELRNQGLSEYNISANVLGILPESEHMPFLNLDILELTELSKISKSAFSYQVFFDFAQGGNDENALAICMTNSSSPNLYVLGYSSRGTWDLFIKEISNILHSFEIQQVLFESNTSGLLAQNVFNSYNIGAKGIFTKRNKLQDIRTLYPLIKNLKIVKDNALNSLYNNNFIKQFKQFSELDKNCLDDAVDATAKCLIENNIRR